MWVFGYGSIMWNPGFAFQDSCVGFVKHYTRRFWQGSTDHRGVPENPGRVVTLVPEHGAICWGVCFQVALEHQQKVQAYLDHRESGGYEPIGVNVHHGNGAQRTAVTYIAHPGNPNYLGQAEIPIIAQQIASAEGPSGRNIDYFLNLVQAIEQLQVEDAHIQSISRHLSGY